MKKEYSKPQITIDSFEISCSVASNCSFQMAFDENTCPVDIGFGTVFADDNICDFLSQDGDGGVCYYIPNMDSTVFTS